MDRSTCGFGQWYLGGGSARYGHLPAFQRIGSLHEQVHALAHELLTSPMEPAPSVRSREHLALLQASRQLSQALDAFTLEVQGSPALTERAD